MTPPSRIAAGLAVALLALAPAAALAQAPDIALNLPRDLSPWGMFMSADIVVKAVMVGLAFASVVTWTVWLAKTLELAAARRRLRARCARSREARSLAEALTRLRGPAARCWRLSRPPTPSCGCPPKRSRRDGIKERVASRLERIEAAGGRRMIRGTGVLATIGATAPFVGLFGTVWGIMNSFIGISKAQTTNLAVVAPGIAEALLATALGLVAAIPAVVIYNMFARSIARLPRARSATPSAEVLRLVSAAISTAATRPVRARRRRRSSAMAARLDHGDDDLAELHEINVTPFIDVMLVLLIIFMVAAPLATVDVAVDLPASTAEPQPRPDKPLFLTLKADLPLALGNDRGRRATRSPARSTPPPSGDKETAHLPARRQERALRRADGGDERAARRRLSEGRAGRAGGGEARAMSKRQIARWGLGAVLALGLHVAGAAALFAPWPHESDAVASAPVILVALSPVAAAPPAPAKRSRARTRAAAGRATARSRQAGWRPKPSRRPSKRPCRSRKSRSGRRRRRSRSPCCRRPSRSTSRRRSRSNGTPISPARPRPPSKEPSAPWRPRPAQRPMPTRWPNWKSRLVAQIERHKSFPGRGARRARHRPGRLQRRPPAAACIMRTCCARPARACSTATPWRGWRARNRCRRRRRKSPAR